MEIAVSRPFLSRFFTSLKTNFLENRWFQEVLVFITLLFLFTLNESKNPIKWDDVWRSSCYFLILFTHAQLHRFIAVPILLDKQKPLTYAVVAICFLVVFSFVVQIISSQWLYPECGLINLSGFGYYLATGAFGLIAILTPYLMLRFYRQKQQQDNSQLCMKELELSQLRSQLNPHFLFNTFNNLYGISLQEPARVPDLILQASKLMRYQLENHTKQWVSLQDELMFIESYIGLEEERVGNRCTVTYESHHDSKEADFIIAPMMLIPFVENAFKHGTDSMGSCFVNICTCLQGDVFYMQIVNSLPAKSERRALSMGIGLQNVKQQLKILYPGNKHKLEISSKNNEYKIKLELILNQKTER